jgi:hypothetical protein
MKFFNFFRGQIEDPFELLFEPTVILDEYNGVTNPFLIETFNEFKTYYEWTEYFSLGIWENPDREYLRFMFNDIDGRKYEVTLLGNESMCIYISIETSFNHFEYELMHFPTEFFADANILLNHIRSLPRALYSRRSS